MTHRRARLIRWISRLEASMVTIFRSLIALVGWIGLALFFYVTVEYMRGMALVHGIINYFSYFTILSNILVALTLTWMVIAPRSGFGTLLAKPGLRTATGMYIMVTGLVYFFVLSRFSQPQGTVYVADVLLHYVVPTLYVIDWLISVPKGTLKFKQVPFWIIFPLIYGGYTLLHGWLTGFYPYPFTNAETLGYSRVLRNFLSLLIGFSSLGLILVATDRLMGRSGHTQPKARAEESGSQD